ncbi:MAG TPA: SLC13 family permease [Tepiditoga sp.]|nr:anion permease [Thermotogota bacterium]HOO74162.1 SLC13 family permease [Tepiditoga sp.]
MNSILVLFIAVLAYYFIIFVRKIKKSIVTFFLATLLFIIRPVAGLDLENVSHIVSFETLGILLGMMIIVEILKESGFFTFTAVNVIKISKSNYWVVLFLLMIVVALFSAFLDNLVTIMLIAPIIFLISDTLEVSPAPLILFTIVIDNIGGMSTLIGSPLNIVLSSISKYDFTKFITAMGPVTILTFIASFIIFKISNKTDTKIYNEKLKKLSSMEASKAIQNKSTMIKGVIVFAVVLAGFILHSAINVDIALVAMGGALVLMLLTGKDFESMAKQLDWDTMFFYAGLFTISFALEEIGVIDIIANLFTPLLSNHIILMLTIMWISSIAIPFLSAVPGTLLLAPVVSVLISHGAPYELWIAFAIGANLGTNLTPLGAVQNIVGVSLISKHSGQEISFGSYMKSNAMNYLITMIIGTFYLMFHFYVFN